jgi:branched-chain amino acid transport system ATP-binding protein
MVKLRKPAAIATDRDGPQGVTLSLAGVRKRFGGVTAVDGVDLEVADGEAVAVIGPNGAGKSTMLKLIAGIHRPDEGQIGFAGARLDRLPPHRIVHHGVALAHQVPRPFPNLTVRENVVVGAVSRRQGTAHAHGDRVDEILDLCGLAEKAELPARLLRVLDLKRLEVARALSTSPRLLMLDEVAAGLVGRELEAAIDLIKRVHATGVTVLLVEHVERVVREVVGRVLVLDWGRPIAQGTPAEVAADPRVREVYLGESSRRDHASRSKPAPESRDVVLEVTGLSAGYGDLIALRDIDIQVQAGEIVAVLGANGAGKSTLSGAISGAVGTRAGTVSVLGQDVTRWPAHKRARLGVAHCQEGRRVFAELTVAENLALGAPLGLGKEQLDARLARVHDTFPVLAERADQAAGTLSGGQQQMLAVGRALMADPKLLICDEISLGLAPVAIDALYQSLHRINGEGVAILLVEQNVHRCLHVSDRAYVLSRGRISYAGAPGALLDEANLDEAYFGHDTDGAPRARATTEEEE